MEFTFEDAEELCSLVSSQQSHVDEKPEVRVVSPSGAPPIRMHFRFPTPLHKRFGALLICSWLESMVLEPDGCIRRAKRPKFLDDV
jgi:hypothetical protein